MQHIAKAILNLVIALMPLLAASTAMATDSTVLGQLEGVLPAIRPDEIASLVSTGEIVNMYSSPEQPRLAPVFLPQVRAELEELNPGLAIEVLVLLDKSEDPPLTALESYRILHSISTMAGIEYYSASRGYMRTLFHESFVIDDPEKLNRLPDPLFDSVPRTDIQYVFQRDSSFGKNVYELRYFADGDAILLSMTNLTRMYYRGVIPALGPERLLMHLVVAPVGGKLLLYGSSGADSINALGMEERVRDSFYNRIVALHAWYLDQLAQ